MIDLLDNPTLGLFFGTGEPTLPKDLPMQINLQFSAGEFSKSDRAHDMFAQRICRFGRQNNVACIGGTEANVSDRNNTAAALGKYGPQNGFQVIANPNGEFLLVNKSFGKVLNHDFHPVIPAEKGLASAGGHGERGILSVAIKPNNDGLGGNVHVGVSHWLTDGTDPKTARGQANLRLEKEIGAWAKQAGSGHDMAFYMGDTNLDDKHRNAFTGVPLISCWDELHKWPVTHPHPNGGGPTLDLIASYNRDQRVKCRSARALNDTALPLPVDHFSVYAEYTVTPIKKGK